MTNHRHTALIGLGSNASWHGRCAESVVRGAFETLHMLMKKAVLSPLYDSPAWPDPAAPAYVNAVAEVQTTLTPSELLAALQAMEAAFGRVRSDDPSARYAPRTLDLDILSYGSEVVESAALTLPHPRMAERDFVLMPLHDLMPDWQHPVLGQTAQELLAGLPSTSASRRC